MKKMLMTGLLALTAVLCHAQSLDVFIYDSNGPFTNVRNAPNGKIVDKIPTDKDAMLIVENATNGWWMICDQNYYIPDGGMCKFSPKLGSLYVHNSTLGVSTRNYGGQRLTLRSTPSSRGKVVYTFTDELVLRPLDAKGNWAKVKTLDGRHTGWIEIEWLCGNSVTNCN